MHPIMNRYLLLSAALLLGIAACNRSSSEAEDVVDHSRAIESDTILLNPSPTPMDWSSLPIYAGHDPHDMLFFDSSAVSPELKTLLGPRFDTFKANMRLAGTIEHDRLLYVIGRRSEADPANRAYLLIDPVNRQIEVGLWENGSFSRYASEGEPLPHPPAIDAFAAGTAR